MLRACRRMLRAGGRTSFATIVVAPGLSRSEHRRAVRLGPRAIASTRPVGALMTAARFVDVDVSDVTDDFLAVARAWFSLYSAREDELRPILGDEWDQRRADRRDLIAGIEEGLLQRVLVTGAVP